METNALTPSDKVAPVDPPIEPLKPELPASSISDKDANDAAKSLGLTFFSAAKSRNLKLIGEYQIQQGVVQLGVGRLAASDEALQKMIQVAVDIAGDDKEDTYSRVSALSTGGRLIEALQKSIQMMADFQMDKLIGGPKTDKKRVFVDEQPIMPIQAQPGSTVNIVVDSKQKAGQS